MIVAISVGLGLIPLVSPNFFDEFPRWTSALTHSGITLTAITAVALNAYTRTRGQDVDDVKDGSG
jgi:xanthine/uracil permease